MLVVGGELDACTRRLAKRRSSPRPSRLLTEPRAGKGITLLAWKTLIHTRARARSMKSRKSSPSTRLLTRPLMKPTLLSPSQALLSSPCFSCLLPLHPNLQHHKMTSSHNSSTDDLFDETASFATYPSSTSVASELVERLYDSRNGELSVVFIIRRCSDTLS